MNKAVELYRESFPEDKRPDDDITLDLVSQFPDILKMPDVAADHAAIEKRNHDLIKSTLTTGDYVKQGAGSFVRGAADTLAALPEAIGIGATGLAKKTGVSLGEPENAEDTLSYKAGQLIRKAGDAIAPEPVQGLEDSFAASTVPNAVGSAAGFMVGGGVGKAAVSGGVKALMTGAAEELAAKAVATGVSEAVAKRYAQRYATSLGAKALENAPIAGLGAAAGGTSAWKEAKAAGASDDEAMKVFLLNAGVGTSEIVPLSRMLSRLDGVSGGSFSKLLIEAGKESFEEGLQEAGQQFAQNYIAKRYYDKDRDLFNGLGENAGAGAITGALFSLITHGVGAKLGKPEAAAKAPATVKAKVATAEAAAGDGINAAATYELPDETKAAVSALAAQEVAGNETPEFYRDREAQVFQFHDKTEGVERAAFYRSELARLKTLKGGEQNGQVQKEDGQEEGLLNPSESPANTPADLPSSEDGIRAAIAAGHETKDRASMSQDEYAAWIAAGGKTPSTGQGGIYKELVLKPSKRGGNRSEPTLEQSSEAYDWMDKIATAGKMREGEGWNYRNFGDSKTKNPDGSRSKAYVTFDDYHDIDPARFGALMNELEAAGYQGAVKTVGKAPFNAWRLIDGFDNIVAHGKTQADVDLFSQMVGKVFPHAKVSFGLDPAGTSHTDALATLTNNARVDKKPFTPLPRRFSAPVTTDATQGSQAAGELPPAVEPDAPVEPDLTPEMEAEIERQASESTPAKTATTELSPAPVPAAPAGAGASLEATRTETTDSIVSRTKVGPERDAAFAARAAAARAVSKSLKPGDVIIDGDGNRRKVDQVFSDGTIFVFGKDGTGGGKWSLSTDDQIERASSETKQTKSETVKPKSETLSPLGVPFSPSVELTDRVDVSKYAGLDKEGGVGKQGSEAFTETDNPAKLYEDSKASASDNGQSHKLGVFVSPDGSHVVAGTAYVNKGKQYVTVPKAGKPGGVQFSKLIESGYKLVATLKTEQPTKGYAAVLKPEQWTEAATKLRVDQQAARNQAAGGEEIVRERMSVKPSGAALGASLTGEATGDDVASADTAAPESATHEVKGFTDAHAGAIFDAIQGATSEDDIVPYIAESHRARNAFEIWGRSLIKRGATAKESVQQLTSKIYEAYNESGRSKAGFTKAISERASGSGLSPAQKQGTESGSTDGGRRGEGAPASGSGQGAEAGTDSRQKAEEVESAAQLADPNPTEAQKEAGNYSMGHVEIAGLDVTIENAKGSTRSGTGPDGPWQTEMPAHYGYVKGTEGNDGDHVDVYIGPNPGGFQKVWVVDQINPKTKKFDEHKALIGFNSKAEALAAYLGGFSDGSGGQRIGEMTEMPREDFVDWVNEGDTGKPLAYGRKRFSERGKIDRSPTLVYLDSDGEPTATPQDQLRPESRLARAISRLAGGYDGRGSARAAATELEAVGQDGGFVLDPEAFTRTIIDGRKELAYGSEHTVYFDKASKRVLKITHADLTGDGAVGQSSDVLSYLRSLQLQNQLFGDDVRLEGIVKLDGELSQIVTSQPFIKGRPATPAEITAYMRGMGYRPVDGGWMKDSIRVSDAVGKNIMAVNGKDGVTILPFDVQVVDTAQRNSVRETVPIERTDASLQAKFQEILDIAHTNGLNVQVLQASVREGGTWSPGEVTLALRDMFNPTPDNLVLAIHETVGHPAFDTLTVSQKEMIQRAFAKLAEGTSPKMAPGVNVEMVKSEEYLVERASQALVDQGFSPGDAKGILQTISRILRDLYLRAAMAFQTSVLGKDHVSPALAEAWFMNRMKSFMTGDQHLSFLSWIGGPRQTMQQLVESCLPAQGSGGLSELFNYDSGQMDYPDLLPDSIGAVRLNIANRRYWIDRKPKHYIGKQFREVAQDVTAQTPDIRPAASYREAESALATLVFDPKPLSGLGFPVNMHSPDHVAQNQSRTNTHALAARVLHALTKTGKNENGEARSEGDPSKIIFAPLVPQTIRQADVVVSAPVGGGSVAGRIFLKFYSVNGSTRWHAVETTESGDFVTQYSFRNEAEANGRIFKGQVLAVGQRAPKGSAVDTLNPVAPDFTETGFQPINGGQDTSTEGGAVKSRYSVRGEVAGPASVKTHETGLVTEDQATNLTAQTDVAALNGLHDMHRAAFAAFERAGLNATLKLSFEQWVESQPGGGVAARIDEINQHLQSANQPTVDPSVRPIDLVSDVSQMQAADKTYRMGSQLRATWTEQRRKADTTLRVVSDRMSRVNVMLSNMMKNAKNAEVYLAAVKNRLPVLIESLHKGVITIGRAEHERGMMEQVIEDLEGRMSRPIAASYERAVNAIYHKLSDVGEGQKFTDILEAVAGLNIDWKNEKPSAIRDMIRLAFEGTSDPLFAPLLDRSQEGRALLTVAIAFAKSDAHAMEMLALRKSKAFDELTVVNEALKKAMSVEQGGIEEARKLVKGLKKIPNAVRLIDRFAELRREQRDSLDELQRAKVFREFHDAAGPGLNAQLAQLERQLGIHLMSWEPNNGAEYFVARPGASDEQVAASKAALKLANVESNDEILSHIQSNKAWMESVPADKRGALWATVMMQTGKLEQVVGIAQHELVIRKSAINYYLGSIVDKLESLGLPSMRSAATRMRRYLAEKHAAVADADNLGVTWTANMARAKKALGMAKVDDVTFDRMFFQSARSFAEKNPEIRAAVKTDAEGFEALLPRLKEYLSQNPEIAKALANPGGWKALEDWYRSTYAADEWVMKFWKKLGLKIEETLEDGSTIQRDPVGSAFFTATRRTNKQTVRMYHVMRELGWLGTKDSNPLDRQTVTAAYENDPATLGATLQKLFTPDVLRDFVVPLVNMEGRSAFYGPTRTDGLTLLASRENVGKAFESAGGNMIEFARNLYQLEAGARDSMESESEFVGRTMQGLREYFDSLHNEQKDYDDSVRQGLPAPARLLQDARTSEQRPGEWMEYAHYDRFSLHSIANNLAGQAALGKRLMGMRQDLQTGISELEQKAGTFKDISQRIVSANPGKSKKQLRELIKAEVELRKLNLLSLEQADRNLTMARNEANQFESLMKLQGGLGLELKPFMELVSAAAGATVQGPGTALLQLADFGMPFAKLGLGPTAIRTIGTTLKSFTVEQFGTLAQMFHTQIGWNADKVARRVRNGIADPDARRNFRDEMVGLINDETAATNVVTNGAFKTARMVKALISSGIGKAPEDSATAFVTAKPHAVFSQMMMQQLFSFIDGWTGAFEDMVERGVKHFNANPDDLANPQFRFDNLKQLGYSKGFLGLGSDERAADWLRTAMARYGLDLETVARDTIKRRAVDSSASAITDENFRKLASVVQNEVTLDSNPASRASAMYTNPLIRMAAPLVSWSVSKSHDLWENSRQANMTTHSTPLKAFSATMLPYLALVPAALAMAWLRDKYDEDLLRKKANRASAGSFNGMVDALARVGTFGTWGDIGNSFINRDTEKPFSMDNRIFFMSSLLNAKRAVQNWYQQEGTADYATVYRPMLQSLGGSGYLQYAQILNTLTGGLIEPEERITARINAMNYIRVAGRELKLDVRTGGGGDVASNPIKPHIGEMVMAAMANDAAGFRQAYMDALKEATAEKGAEGRDYVQRAFQAYNPIKSVFRTAPNEQDYQRILASLNEDGRTAVSGAVRLYDAYAAQVTNDKGAGIPATFSRDARKKASFGPSLTIALPKLAQPVSLEQARLRAVAY